MSLVHECVSCLAAGVPRVRPTCGRCREQTPRPLRRRLDVAWQHRIRDPIRWQEALVEFFIWRRDYIATTRTHGNESGDRPS